MFGLIFLKLFNHVTLLHAMLVSVRVQKRNCERILSDADELEM